MDQTKYVICEVCGMLFKPSDDSNVCSDCKKKPTSQEDETDLSVLDPIIIDGDEDVDFDEDPDYDMDDVFEDDDDSFDSDLDEDLFNEDY